MFLLIWSCVAPSWFSVGWKSNSSDGLVCHRGSSMCGQWWQRINLRHAWRYQKNCINGPGIVIVLNKWTKSNGMALTTCVKIFFPWKVQNNNRIMIMIIIKYLFDHKQVVFWEFSNRTGCWSSQNFPIFRPQSRWPRTRESYILYERFSEFLSLSAICCSQSSNIL